MEFEPALVTVVILALVVGAIAGAVLLALASWFLRRPEDEKGRRRG